MAQATSAAERAPAITRLLELADDAARSHQKAWKRCIRREAWHHRGRQQAYLDAARLLGWTPPSTIQLTVPAISTIPDDIQWVLSQQRRRYHVVWYTRDGWTNTALCGLRLDGVYPWLDGREFGSPAPLPETQCARCQKALARHGV